VIYLNLRGALFWPILQSPLNGAWRKISTHFPNRTIQSIYRHSLRMLHPFKRGAWTEEEALRLVQLVASKGKKWTIIQDLLNRHSDACRDKYREVEGDYHRGEWDESETRELETLVRASLCEQDPSVDLSSLAQKIEDENIVIPWTSISKHMKHRSRLACLLKFSQLSANEDRASQRAECKARSYRNRLQQKTTPLKTVSRSSRTAKEIGPVDKSLFVKRGNSAGANSEVTPALERSSRTLVVEAPILLNAVAKTSACSTGGRRVKELGDRALVAADSVAPFPTTRKHIRQNREGISEGKLNSCDARRRRTVAVVVHPGAAIRSSDDNSELASLCDSSVDEVFPSEVISDYTVQSVSRQVVPGAAIRQMSSQPGLLPRVGQKRKKSPLPLDRPSSATKQGVRAQRQRRPLPMQPHISAQHRSAAFLTIFSPPTADHPGKYLNDSAPSQEYRGRARR
jgi:Myb-like DNA-binding domain